MKLAGSLKMKWSIAFCTFCCMATRDLGPPVSILVLPPPPCQSLGFHRLKKLHSSVLANRSFNSIWTWTIAFKNTMSWQHGLFVAYLVLFWVSFNGIALSFFLFFWSCSTAVTVLTLIWKALLHNHYILFPWVQCLFIALPTFAEWFHVQHKCFTDYSLFFSRSCMSASKLRQYWHRKIGWQR